MTIRIRPATVEDAIGIQQLIVGLTSFFSFESSAEDASSFWVAISPESTAKRLRDPRFRYQVALDGERIVGVVAVRDASHLYHLFVSEDYHRRGIGRDLWCMAREDARASGNPEGGFTVNSSPYAVPVYEKLGFRQVAEPVSKDGIISVAMQFYP